MKSISWHFIKEERTVFWDREIETIKDKKLKALQIERLQKTLRQAIKIPLYRERFKTLGIRPQDIKDLKDIKRLPFTTRDDLRENYPYGMLAIPREKVIRLHTSSGTTGKPKAIFYSKRDIDTSTELIARCFTMTGTTKEDVFQNMMTYGLFTGALIMHYGAEKVGAMVIPISAGNTERQIAYMKDFQTTVIHLTPSYALYLADVITRLGIDPKKELYLKRAYVGAEPYSEETRKKIEEFFSIDVYNSYGLSEMGGPGVAFECQEKNGMHIWEDCFLIEIIDPETGEVLPEGEEGELVITTLAREAMPVIRYRTRDITRIINDRCPCGRTHRRIARIKGRADDMFIVRGVNIFPQQIERVLMGIKGVGKNYQIILEEYDVMIVKVEIDREVFTGKVEDLIQLQETLTEKIRDEVFVKPKVELVEPGTLPATEGKAKRVIDRRTL